MNHLPFTLTAYILNGIGVTIDKLLLTKHIPDPLVYIFYFSLVSLLAIFLTPFVSVPSIEVIIISSFSTLLWTTGAYFMFKALQVGQVSRVIPVIGTIIPTILLIEAISSSTITLSQIQAIVLLLLGIIFITIFDWRGKGTKKEFLFEILSAAFFAISYLFLRQAYLLADNFFSVVVYSRFVLIPIGLALFLIPNTRGRIFFKNSSSKNEKVPSFIKSKGMVIFAVGQISAGFAELLLTFSVSLASPALVNSLQGIQYVFLFFANIILAKKFPNVYKEKFTRLALLTKFVGILFIGGGLFLLAFGSQNNLY